MAKRRPMHSTAVVDAKCSDCPWQSTDRNSAGQAAVHADQTGHEVVWHQDLKVTYERKKK